MQVTWPELLNSLGSTISDPTVLVKQPCPLHPGRNASLTVTEYPETHYCVFRCTDPNCLFDGDAVTLTAAVRQLPAAEAIKLFQPGNELAHTLKTPLTESDVTVYTEQQNTRLRLDIYMTQCRQALRSLSDLSRLRLGASYVNIRFLPPELGLLIGHDVPPAFQELAKPRYQRGQHVIYPYTFNGALTHVRVQNINNGTQPIIPIAVTRQDTGVFMEDNIEPATKDLFATFDPHTAAVLYSEFAMESNRRPPIVGIAGLPLPERGAKLQSITLLSTADAPLTLTDGLTALPGSIGGPVVNVYTTTQTTQTLSADQLRDYLRQSKRQTLTDWLIATMDRLATQQGTEQVFQALNTVSLTAEARQQLIRGAQTASTMLQDLLKTFGANLGDRYVLANGRIFRRTRSGLRHVSPDGTESVMSNFDIAVEQRIRNRAGDEVMVCRITLEDPRIPPLMTRLAEQAFNNATTLQRAVKKAFAERNETPYLACYENSIAWGDVAARLGEHCELLQTVEQLGPNDAREIHLPNVVLRLADHTLAPQRQIIDIAAPILKAYGGITETTTPAPHEAFRKLFQHIDNPYVAGLVAGLVHVVNCMMAGVFQDGNMDLMVTRHLVFVEPQDRIWQPIISQLGFLLSGDDQLVQLGYRPREMVNRYTALGALPLLGQLPAVRNTALAELLIGSPINLMLIADSTVVGASENPDRTWYIGPGAVTDINPCALETEDVLALRAALPGFLLDACLHLDSHPAYRTNTVSLKATYVALCDMLDIPILDAFERHVKPFYADADGASLDSFFEILHRMYVHNAQYFLRVASLTEREDHRYAHAFTHTDYVLLNHTTVAAANRQLSAQHLGLRFSQANLTQELQERGYLLPVPGRFDPSRCWCIARQLWEEKIARTPIRLAPVDTAKPIQLIRIA